MEMTWKSNLTTIGQRVGVNRLTTAVNMFLVVMLAYSLASLTWMLVPAVTPDTNLPQINNEAAASKTTKKDYSVQDIVRWHIFGKDEPVQVAPRPEVMPETTLNLTLRGVFASADEGVARAIIADPSGNENFYGVGSQLPGNATLTEIHPDRIVLSRGGRYETLRLPEDRINMNNGSTDDVGADDNFDPGSEEEFIDESAQSLGEVRNALLNNPQSLANLLAAEPVYEEGQFSGYKLGPAQDQKLLARFGLKRGDVVTGVNGVALDDPAKVPEVLRTLSSANEVRVDYMRNNTPQSTVLRMN